MPTALAISPHLDDAVFSAGATLAGLAARSWRVTVATCFTRSVPEPTGFALACQLDKGLPPDVDYMALRRAEDAEACAALGLAPPVWLDLPEAPHRQYGSAAALFGEVRADDAADQALATLLAPLIAGADLLLAPQAIGGHVDHLVTVAAVDRIRPRPPVLWWADLPYAARIDLGRRSTPERFAALEEAPALAGTDARKLAACRLYRSQIAFQFPQGVDVMRGDAYDERLRAEPDAVRRLAAQERPR